MPELPEVETTRRGITPHVQNHTVTKVVVRQPQLRWPVRDDLSELLEGQQLTAISRRAKYLLLHFPKGTLIGHLGMSGSMRVLPANSPAQKHDHVDLVFNNNQLLRLTDPRRFGAMVWTEKPIEEHELLTKLGPEPLSDAFTGELLFQCSRSRKQPVKTFIMDSHNVVGVGNIYANEALFMAGIRPDRACGRISRKRYDVLANSIKTVLTRAIEVGGTTLKDFVGGDGRPGYFAIELTMYGRAGEPCQTCGTSIKEIRLNNRSTCFCPKCQS
ncbi:bifunctional DNA-formamidopyrimidine glycosylase/DNA-(apurinic or apyrimidinic site) lyase [Sansalvadorimonas verongulae]|uniref:bifunctional DNA-formamidopyrimidine glycosylase/DNA-(apurinic or apyrimidinic site) lyase n=1 Tax=Sansalvadorimonas verongulae TaxID=2172824 RepID=UPI0012BCF579|nr:bifunctional DNA-formamidopyrimidine glycosylase/DNA-(apurinic or apyrimidinic site) lyase [Sansalvadorimonas verongulae]MTI14597.1 bifunctional DNA-formamidopyrimidine glycosylase/DNA-(apurinic or apyrimidinic site) lyase [Sansalvadorimonas verongulae]